MLRNLVTILLFSLIVWSSHSQNSIDFREQSSLPASVYWTKAFDLLNQNRLEEAKNLTDDLFKSIGGDCLILNKGISELNTAYKQQLTPEIVETLTRVIVNSVLIDIRQLSTEKSPIKRKEKVISLFKEIIAIQKEFKALDFKKYRALVVCFRRMNQLVSDDEILKNYIQSIEFINDLKDQC